ncbi:hypothetical protein GVN16_24190 [Emticicia sp. CRIBPO]|uniref:hypothetical protein n=1 Tax=Emticicia sp. CRIBPO TaxID=2683258 RepID=UPI001412EADC|nr:hypothetical protein [Emticicia sp. CRIBPO]NBA88897.1 hypothetical protein [Emticicia sp. CRIBPO]
MKKYPLLIITGICFLISISSVSIFAQAVRSAHVGLVYPLSTNGVSAPEISNAFSLHAISGVSKNEQSVAIAGVASIVKEHVRGVQISGVYNHAGISVHGAQIAGFGNYAKTRVEGAQIAGFMNMTGPVNSQIGGFLNVATDVKGGQIAGFMNKSGDVNAQVAGFINIAKKVKGVQIAGFINIADSSDYPIGIINIIKNGEKSIGVSYDESGTALATFRSGGRVLYSVLGVGYNLKETHTNYYALEAGIGARLYSGKIFRLNAELATQVLTDFREDPYSKNTLRILPTLRIGNRVEVFAGPSLNYAYYDRDDHHAFVKKFIWKNKNSDDFHGFHVGYNLGVQIVL